jgi:hypothetical protein
MSVIFVTTGGTARGEGFVTPYLGYNFGGDSANCPTLTNCENKHPNFGVSLGAANGILGIEEDIAYAKDFFGSVPGADNNVFTAMTNVMAGVFAGPVQPFVLAGVGLIRTHVSLNPVQSTTATTNSFGWDLGGGIAGFFGSHVGVRGDLRHFHTFGDVSILRLGPVDLVPSEKLDYWRGSIGVAFRF